MGANLSKHHSASREGQAREDTDASGIARFRDTGNDLADRLQLHGRVSDQNLIGSARQQRQLADEQQTGQLLQNLVRLGGIQWKETLNDFAGIAARQLLRSD